MKYLINTITIALACVLVAVSCNKTETQIIEPAVEQQDTGDDGLFDVWLSFNTPHTKSLSAGEEEKVNEVQIYVFDKDNGNRLESFYNGKSTTPKMRLSAGNKLFKVLINSKVDSTTVTSLETLEAKLSDFSDNTTSNFVMSGELTKEITSSSSVEISVYRLAAKVILSKISTNFTAPVYAAKEFKVDSIYLTHVAKKCCFFGTYTPDSWGKGYALTADAPNAEVKDKKYEVAHTFYTYPNGTATPTRLVIKATLGDTPYYYPIDLGEIKSNMVYTVTNVEITRPGSSSEDSPIVSSEIPFKITVGTWSDTVNNIQEVI